MTLLVATALGCSDDDQAADPAVVDAITGVRWDIAGYVDGDEVLDVDPAGDDAFLVFEPDGGVTGDDGCNDFTIERYRIGAERIRYGGERLSQLAGCFALDAHIDRFAAISRGAVGYELDGDELRLLGGDGEGVLFTTGR